MKSLSPARPIRVQSSGPRELSQYRKWQRTRQPRPFFAVIRVGENKVIGTGLVQELLAFGDLGLEIGKFAVHVIFLRPAVEALSFEVGPSGALRK